ncbi:MAG: hypothetical protein LBI03_04720, partial [Clostridiales bacterium]|nr:hypothetical protein [Clostridiales bacterium]
LKASSSNSDVIEINKNGIEVKSPGKTNLTLTYYIFTVKKSISVSNIVENIQSDGSETVKIYPGTSIRIQETVKLKYTYSNSVSELGYASIGGWFTSDQQIATILNDGTLIGWKPGKCSLYTFFQGKKVEVPIEVANIDPTSIYLELKDGNIYNDTISINSKLYDFQNPLTFDILIKDTQNEYRLYEPGMAEWTTEDPEAINLLGGGIFLPQTNGISKIKIKIFDTEKEFTININSTPPIKLEAENEITLDGPGPVDINIYAVFANGSRTDVTALVKWSSSNNFVIDYYYDLKSLYSSYMGTATVTAEFCGIKANINVKCGETA